MLIKSRRLGYCRRSTAATETPQFFTGFACSDEDASAPRPTKNHQMTSFTSTPLTRMRLLYNLEYIHSKIIGKFLRKSYISFLKLPITYFSYPPSLQLCLRVLTTSLFVMKLQSSTSVDILYLRSSIFSKIVE
jgi:hypothetical protein